MANTIDWGKATQNNTNGFGKYQNTINAGIIYADSYSGETTLVGTSAAFSYSASSFHQGEADPTPTITGTTGGTFSATPSGLSINTSTGTIDLDNSTIQSYTITYTVSGVSANQTLAVTASPFVDNNFSMEFDSASSQYVNAGNDASLNFGTGNGSVSCWFKTTQNVTGAVDLVINGGFSTGGKAYILYLDSSEKVGFALDDNSSPTTPAQSSGSVADGNWHHVIGVRESGNIKLYLDGSLVSTQTDSTGNIDSTDPLIIGAGMNASTGVVGNFYDGKIDEVAIWNAALSSDAITEIYNATANNTGKVLDLNTDTGNYTSSANLQYWNRLGD